jgi:aspartate racemase
VQPAIYLIKIHGKSSKKARESLHIAINNLKQKGAEAIILGCTEIPLAITETEIDSMIVIDPTTILARALIREANPAKLRP